MNPETDSTPNNPHSSLASAPAWLLVGHGSAVVLALGISHVPFHAGALTWSEVGTWLTRAGLVLTVGAALSAAWSLIRQSGAKGHFWPNTARLCWVLTLLVVVGEWSSVRYSPVRTKVSRTAIGAASPKDQNSSKPNKVDEIRARYPRFADLSDAEILRAVASDYPEVPIEKIAADLGLKITRVDQ